MRIGTGIYVKNSGEAVRLYLEAFGLELGYHVCNPDGSYFHCELNKDGQELFDVAESSVDRPMDNIVQVSAILDDAAAVEKAYSLLSRDGKVEMPMGPLPWSPCAAILTDAFGVWWYLSAPQHRPDDAFDPSEMQN